jgi:hypothetical protein
MSLALYPQPFLSLAWIAPSLEALSIRLSRQPRLLEVHGCHCLHVEQVKVLEQRQQKESQKE